MSTSRRVHNLSPVPQLNLTAVQKRTNIQTRAKIFLFLSFFSLWEDNSKWATKWMEVGWIFWKMSENCYRCFCHVGLKLKSPINGKTVMSGPLIYYYPYSSQASWHAKQPRQASLSLWVLQSLGQMCPVSFNWLSCWTGNALSQSKWKIKYSVSNTCNSAVYNHEDNVWEIS